MAGFLQSRGPDASRGLEVCPVFAGPALLSGTFGLCVMLLIFSSSQAVIVPWEFWGGLALCALTFPCLTCLAYVVLIHCRSIDVVQQQVRCFTIGNASSYCCASNHIDPSTGERMVCDRLIIERCIAAWFGSPEQFEETVRGKLRVC